MSLAQLKWRKNLIMIRKDKKSIIYLILIFSISFGLSLYVQYNQNNLIKTKDHKKIFNLQFDIKNLGFWNLTGTKIFINGTATGVNAHNWTWVKNQAWFGGGNGTFNSPYIIENITIDSQGNGDCIEIYNSNVTFIIRNCTLYNTNPTFEGINVGIELVNVNNGHLINNTLYNNSIGISLIDSYSNSIMENKAYNNSEGIHLYRSGFNNITDNILSYNNLINTYFDNIGLFLKYGEYNTISRNQVYKNNGGGIGVQLGNNNKVSENNINSNEYIGLGISHGENNTIFKNQVIRNKYHGIVDWGQFNNISENDVIANEFRGIWVLASGGWYNYTSHSYIIKNNILDNGYGIDINTNNSFWGGIVLSFCKIVTISGNNIENNDDCGILLFSVNDTLILRNLIKDNNGVGLLINETSVNNLIYNNSFIGNELNAEDNGKNNQWDNGLIGNYWDDYSGKDKNDNGIGDTPYDIPGSAGSKDNFPKWDDGSDKLISGYNLIVLIGIIGIAFFIIKKRDFKKKSIS